MDNLEKKLRKRGMQKLDKYAHNPYHVNKPSFFKRIPLWSKIAVPASLMTAVTVVAFFGLVNSGLFGARGNAAKAPSQQEGFSPEGSVNNSYNQGAEKSHLDEQSIANNGINYAFLTKAARSDVEQPGADAFVNEENLGNYIGEVTYGSVGEKASLYEIKNYSPDVFIAAKSHRDSKNYVCYNLDASFSTINDFLDKVPFLSDSSIENNTINLYDNTPGKKTYKNADTATINSYLFTDTGNAAMLTSYIRGQDEGTISLPFTLNTFDFECITITLTEGGYMRIKIGDDSKNDKNIYNVGTSVYSAVETYVKSLES